MSLIVQTPIFLSDADSSGSVKTSNSFRVPFPRTIPSSSSPKVSHNASQPVFHQKRSPLKTFPTSWAWHVS